ncbi:MAG TPA: transglutaminase domain-containing protein [Flavobacterium sp.]|nr:transglutaminase domain-containing protein [Flavobacterium sp.]
MKKITLLLYVFCICSNIYSQQIKKNVKKTITEYPELEAVIKHYKKNGNKEKLQAAYFLIANIGNKGTYTNDLVDSKGISVGYDISNFKDETAEKKWLDSVTAVRGKLHEKETFLPDLKNSTAPFLINNIDRAFEVRQKSPFCKDLTDAEFYEYILPYRVGTEKLEYWRDQVLNDFSASQKDSIYSFSTVLAATSYIDKIYQKKFQFGGNRYFKEKKVRSYSELLQDKSGKCDDMCNLMVFALRALGIPSGFDGIQYKRASNDVGHGWCFVLDTKTKKNYPFDALSNNGPGFFNLPYKNAPKVLRKQFALISPNSIKNDQSVIHPNLFEDNSLDVTSEYFETTNLTIPLEKKYQGPIYLSIWNNGWWKPVDYSYDTNQTTAIFNNVSKENLYCLTKYRYFSTEEASEPFIINKFGEIKHINSLPSKKDINLNEYKNKELKNAKNNAKILEFDTKKEICKKIVEENITKNEWSIISENHLKTNTLYHFVDEPNNMYKIFLLKNDGSVDWY